MSEELDGVAAGGENATAIEGMRIDSREVLAGALSMDDEPLVATWCRRYGITRDQLILATRMVGHMPAALHFYLTSRGRPTKVVTDAMRAARAPIRPRDRRRKDSP